jgi:ribosomal protein S12 methylthiotransferase
MNRKVTKRAIITLLEKIRKLNPHIAVRTAFIVGFPSETDEEFKELLSFIKEMRFDRLGVFTYSREEGTQAYSLPRQITEKIKQERFDAVMQLQQDISREHNAHFQGKDVEVMIDSEERGLYLGRTQYDAPEVDGMVYVHSKKPLTLGTFVKTRITDTLEYDLVGEAV